MMKRQRWMVHSTTALALIVASGCACRCQDTVAPAQETNAPTAAVPQGPPPTGAATAPPSPEPTTAPSAREIQPESHEDGWRAFLAALQSGDPEQVRSRCTEAGYQTLLDGMADDEPPATVFKRWGQGWSNWEIRWVSTTPTRAQASMGPEVKAHGIWLVKEGPVWMLERWAPGK